MPEVVEQAATRPVPRWVWAALVVVLLLGATAWAVDEQRRGREDAAIDDCRARLVEADAYVSARLMSMSDYIRPSLSSVPPRVARRLGEMLEPRAEVALPRVEAAARACQGVRLWSWHGSGQVRLAATLAYADGLLDRLERIADRGLVYFAPDRRLDRLRARAGVS